MDKALSSWWAWALALVAINAIAWTLDWPFWVI